MNTHAPLRTALAFAATAAVLYIGCAIAAATVPGGLGTVLTSFVHSVNMESLLTDVPALTLTGVLLGTVLVSAYAFVAGLVYAWMGNLFGAGLSTAPADAAPGVAREGRSGWFGAASASRRGEP